MCTSIYSQVRKYLDTGSFGAFAFIHHDNGFEIKQGVIKVQSRLLACLKRFHKNDIYHLGFTTILGKVPPFSVPSGIWTKWNL